MRSLLPASRIACVLLALGVCSIAQAAASVCDDPAEKSSIAIAFTNHAQSALEGHTASTNQENQDFDLLVAPEGRGFAWGFAHRYLIFDFSGLEPQTNAHLHTSFLPLHWTLEGRRTVRFSAAVALSTSSNVMGHPREWDSETPQLLAAVVATSRVSDTLGLRYGICADHRFGEYTLYPAAAILWSFRPAWRLELGFPTASLRFEPGRTVRTTLGVRPEGNQWHVENRDFSAGSRFVYESVVLEWTADWRVHERLTLSLRLGRQLDNRYEMTLADGQHVFVSGEAANRVGFGARWQF